MLSHQHFTNNTLSGQGNPRTTGILAAAKANSLELEVVHTEPAKGVSDDYKKLNKLGKVPTFEGADGYVLIEAMAIAVYSELPSALFCSVTRWCGASNDEIYTTNSYPCLKTTVEKVFTL